MTTIDELDEMDFVNWDATGADTGLDLHPLSVKGVGASSGDAGTQNDETNMDLVLGDIDGDDWSFWALQHFESNQMPQDLDLDINVPSYNDPMGPMAEPLLAQLYWETPEAPCGHCALGGYQCKLIQEGSYKGYCTSCVALRCECSFGPRGNTARSGVGATFPANPWPIMGDRPETSILHEDDLAAVISHSLNTTEPGPSAETTEGKIPSLKNLPKIGARFSRESVRILKNWAATHNRHPYPTEEEKESLQKLTGLNKTQITNWLANARRRGKVQPVRSTSPHIGPGYASAFDIPKRRGTPGMLDEMNPLQRWANSPPENEPALVTDIARAVNATTSHRSLSSGLNSPYLSGYSDDGSGRSLCNQSSASSLSRSHGSSGSFASSLSRQSRGSFGSLPSFARTQGRRRRRRAPPKPAETQLHQPLKTFQCTFCTETFRTKHDWQRHEKSLHLSLERWVCSPDGATATNLETGLISCVFCGKANCNAAHIESHNFSSCTERALEERTFYRKDHLRQHLKLVHNVKFLQWSMDKWKVATPEIRSRCGFCGVFMDNWTVRVDHLAEHFKTGNTMADWKGEWGFEAPVLEMVENSIPPYLIHDERNSSLPYVAGTSSPSTPDCAYDVLKLELQDWLVNWTHRVGRRPRDSETQQEACRIIFGAEALSRKPSTLASSWLRDLIMSNDETRNTAMIRPVRGSRMASLRINGKDSIFENCEVEAQLQEFVKARQLLGLTSTDAELQTEACRIIGRMEEKCSSPSEDVANWVLRLVHTSPKWLADFRKRAYLPRSEDIGDAHVRSKDVNTIDNTVHNHSRLEYELGDFLQVQRSLGVEPTDADLQRQARLIIYEVEDPWNQTAADDIQWLENFKHRHQSKDNITNSSASSGSPNSSRPGALQFPGQVSAGTQSSLTGMSKTAGSSGGPHSIRCGPFFLNEANCYRRLARVLSRFVASTTSANNPNSHVPTDEEIQHQARWIVYDNDDPCNQTAADNAEWLQRFKRDIGILPPASGPGLSTEAVQWSANTGDTDFAPPYVFPYPNATLAPLDTNPQIFCSGGSKPFEPDAATANRFLQSSNQCCPAPAKVFCSRELENGLAEYVKREMQIGGTFPSDDQMRDRAREIMSMQKTPCDDPVLLERFKTALKEGVVASSPKTAAARLDLMDMEMPPLTIPNLASGAGSVADSEPTMFPTDLDLDLTTQELNSILQGMNNKVEIGDGSLLNISLGSQNDAAGSGSGLGSVLRL